MKATEFFQKLVLRTPAEPLSTTLDENLIQSKLKDPAFLEAIYLASPHLYDASQRWLSGQISSEKDRRKFINSISKYITRMRSRATPFGLFSAISVLDWGESTKVEIGNKKRHTRLDMDFLCNLAQKLSEIPVIRNRILFTSNNSLYLVNGAFRYVEYLYLEGQRKHQISSIENNIFIKKIIEKTTHNSATIDTLAQLISSENIDINQAKSFINDLIDTQLLVSELQPTLTGDEYFYHIIGTLKKINFDKHIEIEHIIKILFEIENVLKILDSNTTNEVSKYREIIYLIQKLDIDFVENNLFQADLNFSGSCNNYINESYKELLFEAQSVLINLDNDIEIQHLIDFKSRFFERFENDEVALLNVLDTENGISYIVNNQSDYTPLIENMDFSIKKNSQINLTQNQEILLNALTIAVQNNEFEIDLSDFDFEKKLTKFNFIQPTYSAIFRLLNNKEIFIEGFSGSSAKNLIGRFAFGNIDVAKMSNEIAEFEQMKNDNVIFAEIIHLPEKRTGNILMHPSFHQYEIPYLAQSTMPVMHQIQLSDLFIKIENSELVLFSKKHQKIVIPRLSNSHNYTFDSLPVYQFLCDLQYQNGRRYLGFDWGLFGKYFSFLPRVRKGKIIFSPATWFISKNELVNIKNIESFIQFKGKLQLPNLFILVSGDHELLIDGQNEYSINMFIDETSQANSITIKEFFDYSNTGITNAGGQVFVNQMITSLMVNDTLYNGNFQKSKKWKVKNNYKLGTEWLYVKLYCGAKVADIILEKSIKTLINQLQKSNLIDQWFFIRYNDPESHLRIRFHIKHKPKFPEVFNIVNETICKLETKKMVWKFQYDTYSREMERYGGNCIHFSEKLFYENSQVLLEFLRHTKGDDREQMRWLFCIKILDKFFNAFGINIIDRIELLLQLRNNFLDEFSYGSKDKKIILDQKYRENKAQIFKFMNSYNPFDEICSKYEAKISPICTELLKIIKTGNNEFRLLISSHLHMQINRIISSSPRQHELLIYDFMYRFYVSKNAINSHLF